MVYFCEDPRLWHCAVSANGSSFKENTDPPLTDFDMKVTGARLGGITVFVVRAGTLKRSMPFAVSVNGSSGKYRRPWN